MFHHVLIPRVDVHSERLLTASAVIQTKQSFHNIRKTAPLYHDKEKHEKSRQTKMERRAQRQQRR